MALSRGLGRAAAVLTVALGVALAGAPAATAHGGPAVFEVLAAEEVAPGQVEVRLRITYENDGDPAEGAIVELAATGPGGAAVSARPAVRQAEPGVYLATLDLDPAGSWLVTATSAFPPGETTIPVTVSGGTGATAATTPSSTAPSPTATVTPTSVPAATATPTTLAEPEAGSTTLNLVVAAVSGVIGGALGLWVSRRRSARRAGATTA